VKPQGKGNHKKCVAVVAAAAAAIGLAGILVGVLHAAPSFLHIRQNLSNTAYTSAYPDMAVSADHNYVAVVWVDGYSGISGSKGHVYLRVASESGGMGDRIKVYNGDAGACAYDRAAVAIAGTTAHIAHVVWEPCRTRDDTLILYTTCSLTSGTCSLPQVVLSPSAQTISWVDIAVDESGNPHLVYAQYEGSSLTGKIFYIGHNGSSWGSALQVHGSGNNHTPAIAWGGGCAHITWEEETGSDILYRRRCAGVWYPLNNPSMISYGSPTPDHPHQPDIATTSDGRVFIVWDCLAQSSPPPPTRYLVYKRSNNNGDDFYPPIWPLEVGTDNDRSLPKPYTEEHVVGAESDVAYLKYLQPFVALNQDGWPAVVWHVGDDERGVYYTYAISGTDSSVDWVMTKTQLFAGEAGAPVVEFGDLITGTIPLLHVAYMDATGSSWEIYYDSNEADVLDIPTVYLPLVMRGY
jgi:hypothetical protein